MKAFDGGVRYLFNVFHLTALSYFPMALMIFALTVKGLEILTNLRIKKVSAILFTIIVLFVINGLINISVAKQILWGLYILVPFFFGFSFSFFFLENTRKFLPYFYWILVVASLGVIFDYFIDYPWMGFSYEFAGETIEGSRVWSTHDINRLAGFGRTSFSTAVIIGILGLLLLSSMAKTGKNKKMFLWSLSFSAIILTTTKGIIIAYFFISLLMLFRKWIPIFVLKALPVLIVITMILLPFVSAYYFEGGISYSENDNLDSFFIRITSTWPQGIHAITNAGNAVLGRGMGGIGIPGGKAGDSVDAGPADNMAVYIYGIGGGIGLFLLFLVALRSSNLISRRIINIHWLIYLMLIFIFSYGITTNIVESAILSLIFGVIVRALMNINRLKYVNS